MKAFGKGLRCGQGESPPGDGGPRNSSGVQNQPWSWSLRVGDRLLAPHENEQILPSRGPACVGEDSHAQARPPGESGLCRDGWHSPGRSVVPVMLVNKAGLSPDPDCLSQVDVQGVTQGPGGAQHNVP